MDETSAPEAGRNSHGQSCLVVWRDLRAMNCGGLEDWFVENREHFPHALDFIYVNGDHTLNAIRKQNETWIAESIEPLFRELMFETEDDR